jgi:orotate phosphoribosyltransferase
LTNRRELAAAVYQASHLTGEFRLRSGAVSSQYFDKYRFEGNPRLLKIIADALSDLVGQPGALRTVRLPVRS